MLDGLKTRIPARWEPLTFRAWLALRPAVRLAFAGRTRYCPVCGSNVRRFLSHGSSGERRPDVMCPVCLSHERHRVIWLYLKDHSPLNDGRPRRFLHFAPEAELARRFRRIPGIDYLSADLDSPLAMLHTDITALDLPDACFDVVYCSHVLEHVQDDRTAMAEMFRVLRPGGWAIIQVPINPSDARTFEDPSVTDPTERQRLFWQHDHVRLYGLDITDRLRAAGFHVEPVAAADFLSDHELERLAVGPAEWIFRCVKPAG